MQNKDNIYDIQAIGEIIERIYSGEQLSEEENREIVRMISDAGVRAEMEETIERLAEMPGDAKQDAEWARALYERIVGNPDNGIPRFTPKRGRLIGRTLRRVAAVLIPLFVLGSILTFRLVSDSAKTPGHLVARKEAGSSRPIGLVYTAGPNGGRLVELPDGSRVRLEEGTVLKVAAGFPENRRVTLTGNAFFAVAKQDGNPFEVACNELSIRVLGTEFYVREQDRKAEVTLYTGSVEVALAESKVLLEPNQQYVTDLDGAAYSVVELTAAEAARAYRGRLSLHRVAL